MPIYYAARERRHQPQQRRCNMGELCELSFEKCEEELVRGGLPVTPRASLPVAIVKLSKRGVLARVRKVALDFWHWYSRPISPWQGISFVTVCSVGGAWGVWPMACCFFFLSLRHSVRRWYWYDRPISARQSIAFVIACLVGGAWGVWPMAFCFLSTMAGQDRRQQSSWRASRD